MGEKSFSEPILTVYVKCQEQYSVSGSKKEISVIPFTGYAKSRYFNGDIIGIGTDTQKKYPDGKAVLSARYMLDGSDFLGNKCRIFIENNTDKAGGLRPEIVTDSPALSEWETAELKAETEPSPVGVTVKIFTVK